MKYSKTIRIDCNSNIILIDFDKIIFNGNVVELYLKDSFISSMYIQDTFTFTYDSTNVVHGDKVLYFNLNINDSILN